MGRLEAQQRSDARLVAEILADAFLQHLPELAPEDDVVLLAVLGHVLEHREHALGAAFPDRLHVAALLEDLARHVERQVVGIDDALHEAQVGRHQLLRIGHDEHAAHVQADAVALLAVPQVERGAARHEEKLRVLGAALDAVVRIGERRVRIVAEVPVELVVVLLLELRLGPQPQSARLVDRLPFVGLNHLLGILVPLGLAHANRQRDVVRVVAHDAAQLVVLQERVELVAFVAVGGVVAQVEGHVGAARSSLDPLHRELARAVRGPAHALVGRQAGAAAFNDNALGHDERRVEPDAELADQVGILGGIAGQPAEELPGTGAGDRAEVRYRLVARKAHAVVGDPYPALVLVVRDADAELGVALVQRIVVDGLEAQLVAGVRGVGDQLAQEDLAVAVQRVDHQVQQLLDLRLEAERLGRRVGSCGVGHVSM